MSKLFGQHDGKEHRYLQRFFIYLGIFVLITIGITVMMLLALFIVRTFIMG